MRYAVRNGGRGNDGERAGAAKKVEAMSARAGVGDAIAQQPMIKREAGVDGPPQVDLKL